MPSKINILVPLIFLLLFLCNPVSAYFEDFDTDEFTDVGSNVYVNTTAEHMYIRDTGAISGSSYKIENSSGNWNLSVFFEADLTNSSHGDISAFGFFNDTSESPMNQNWSIMFINSYARAEIRICENGVDHEWIRTFDDLSLAAGDELIFNVIKVGNNVTGGIWWTNGTLIEENQTGYIYDTLPNGQMELLGGLTRPENQNSDVIVKIWNYSLERDVYSLDMYSPLNQTYFEPFWVNVTTTFNVSTCFAEIGSTNNTMANDSNTHYYLYNNTLPDGFYGAVVWCNDSSDNWYNSNSVNFTRWTKPSYSGITSYPATGQTYPLAWTQFNITYTTSHTIDIVLVEHNFTGTTANHSMDNDGTEYYYNFTGWSVGQYSFRFYGNDTNGFSNSTELYYYAVNPADSNLEMSVTPSWTVNKTGNTTVSCSATTNVTLYKDNVVVPNPHVTTLPNGIYNYTCVTDDQVNYTPSSITNFLNIAGLGFGCTDNTTYAFSKNITGFGGSNLTLNFTTIIRNGFAKADLTDIYVAETNTWINTTDGYYLLVNVTGMSNFVVEFGNYISNISHSFSALSENVTNIVSYTEQNSYYVITIFDEISGTESLPPDANTSITFICLQGTTTFSINDTRLLIPTYDTQLEEMMATVSYSGDSYSRILTTESPVEYINIYLADAFEQTVLQIPIYVTDYSYYNSDIEIYKTSTGSSYTITDGSFDVDHKFVTYLIKDEKYYIRITKGTETRDMGFFYPATATGLYLTLNIIALKPDISLISNNLQMSAETNNATSSLHIQYYDMTNQTNSVQILVYEGINQTAFWDTTYNAMSNITVTISPINTSKRYSVRFLVNHQVYGNSPVEFTIGVGGLGVLFDLGLGVSMAWIYPVFGFIIMLFAALVTVPKNRLAGLIFLIVALALFLFVQWFQFAVAVLVLLIIFITAAVIYELKRGGMT